MGHRSKAAQQQNPIEVKPQRYTWKTVGTFDRHAEALACVENQYADAKPAAKIKLRGTRFEIRIGKPLGKPKAAPAVEPEAEAEEK